MGALRADQRPGDRRQAGMDLEHRFRDAGGLDVPVKDNEKITERTHPEVSFQLDRLVVYGRLEEGQAPVR